jgi:hypothetical protein
VKKRFTEAWRGVNSGWHALLAERPDQSDGVPFGVANHDGPVGASVSAKPPNYLFLGQKLFAVT